MKKGEQRRKPYRKSVHFGPEEKQKFLEVYRETGSSKVAAKTVGVAFQTAYRHRADDPDFFEQWVEADEEYTQSMEVEADRRGVQGVDEPIWYAGKNVGTIKRYSDILLIFRLKAKRPLVYRDNAVVKHEFDELTDEQLIARAKGLFGGLREARSTSGLGPPAKSIPGRMVIPHDGVLDEG